ncbi:MAG TPA: hypothetical protein DHW22_06185 [Planctomycetaceae bacterium]|nr:hypothetical protein [Planctomycetaceae bacterium]
MATQPRSISLSDRLAFSSTKLKSLVLTNARNDIVHVINDVLLPPPDAQPAQFAAGSDNSVPFSMSLSAASVPEPSSLGLAGTLLSIVLVAHRRSKQH